MFAPDATGQNLVTEATVPSHPSLAPLGVLIPAWQPGAALLQLMAELSQRGFGRLLVIDDGSTAACGSLFAEVANLPGVEVRRHAVNHGKGRALKTGFHHLLSAHPDLLGVITADADGQHRPDDIENVAHALLSNYPRPVLGCRRFDRDVPWRSRLGNTLTRRFFGLLMGTRLADTQTGLRGLPLTLLPDLLALEGERYEYEMTMLAHLCRSGPTPREIPIATVYLEDNRDSHFHPVLDSLRVCFALLRSFGQRHQRAS